MDGTCKKKMEMIGVQAIIMEETRERARAREIRVFVSLFYLFYLLSSPLSLSLSFSTSFPLSVSISCRSLLRGSSTCMSVQKKRSERFQRGRREEQRQRKVLISLARRAHEKERKNERNEKERSSLFFSLHSPSPSLRDSLLPAPTPPKHARSKSSLSLFF